MNDESIIGVLSMIIMGGVILGVIWLLVKGEDKRGRDNQ